MVEFKNILCPVDLSDASIPPLGYAATVAHWYGAHLTALHVVPTFEAMQVRAGTIGNQVRIVQPMTRDEVVDALRTVAKAVQLETGEVTLAAEAGETVPTIVDRAVAIPADLLVMGTHGRSGFDRFLLGSVAEKVLHKVPCPVLTVPPHAPVAVPATVTFERILCPVDFSPSALLAFGFALDLARQAGGAVTVLHAIEWLADEAQVQASFNLQEYRQQLIDDAGARLRTLVSEQPSPGCEVEQTVVTGKAYRAILEVAEDRETDLIVMGAQGRGGVGLSIFGSTTQQIVRRAACPVLTVRG